MEIQHMTNAAERLIVFNCSEPSEQLKENTSSQLSAYVRVCLRLSNIYSLRSLRLCGEIQLLIQNS
jgi:hypothetical protein